MSRRPASTTGTSRTTRLVAALLLTVSLGGGAAALSGPATAAPNVLWCCR